VFPALSVANPLPNMAPNSAARSAAAPAIGMWSAMSSNEPPSRTHSRTTAISATLNADGFGSTQRSSFSGASAFAITSTRTESSATRVKGARFGRTRYPSRRNSSANGM
jgi:hypothetical protein